MQGQAPKTKVLFLCSSNSARSQMAEAFLRTYAGDRFEAYSAGTEPKDIHPLTKRVMEEAGIDISGQRSKSLRDYMGRMHFGYLITVCSEAEKRCPATFPDIGQREHWGFEDPASYSGSELARLEKFREIRDKIKLKIQEWVDSQGKAPPQS